MILLKTEQLSALIQSIESVIEDTDNFSKSLRELIDERDYEAELLTQTSNLLNSIDSKLTIATFYLKNAKIEMKNNIGALSDYIHQIIFDCLWIKDANPSMFTTFKTEIRPIYTVEVTNHSLSANPITDESFYTFHSLWDFIRNKYDTELNIFLSYLESIMRYYSESLEKLSLSIRNTMKPILASPEFVMSLSIKEQREQSIQYSNNLLSSIGSIQEMLNKIKDGSFNIQKVQVALCENQDIFDVFHNYCRNKKEEQNQFATEGSNVTLI